MAIIDPSNIIINGLTNIYADKYYIDTFPFDNDICFNKFKCILGTNRPNTFKMIFELSLLTNSGKKYELDHWIFFEILLGTDKLFIKEIQELDSFDDIDVKDYTEFTRDTTFYDWITVNDYNRSLMYDPTRIVNGFHDITFNFAN